jgi:Flp pilus assembly protein TadD
MEQDLRQILSNDPDNATALNALGYSLAILTDRLNEARALVSKALQLRPDDPAIQDSYGWIAYRLGDLELAENYLSKAFSQSKDHEIAAHLGEVLWRLGQREQAISVWQQGLSNDPSSTIIIDTLQRLQVNLPDAKTP